MSEVFITGENQKAAHRKKFYGRFPGKIVLNNERNSAPDNILNVNHKTTKK
jgi:hypothetical protein